MKDTLFDAWNPEDLLDNTAYLVIDLGRLMRKRFDAEMAALGLSRSEWLLLANLCFFNGSTQQELADILDLTKGGMAKLIDRMEAKDLVRRENDSRDGRATKRIYLTDKAIPLALTVDKGSVAMVKQWASPLSDEQRATLHELLRTVRKGMLESQPD